MPKTSNFPVNKMSMCNTGQQVRLIKQSSKNLIGCQLPITI